MICVGGRGALYGEVWYDEVAPRDARVDIMVFRQRQSPEPAGSSALRSSLVTDLSIPAEQLMHRFGSDCRYKIRRADARDRLQMEFIAEPGQRLEDFRRFFDAFAAQRTLAPCDQRWLTAACKARQLVLAVASRDGAALVWHAYVIAGSTAGLMYTASHFRDGDSECRSLVGRANRWLHWRDMLALRALGLLRYDWGGLFDDESTPDRAGINGFKRDFGGSHQRSFDTAIPTSLRGRFYLPLREAWRRLTVA
ncbi:MAG TPA: hypothetical protein VE046_01430 [Steroidobacteraceae bacterium]|nr:hypothetical protein [Steroidobacteraceae bacterium]